MVELNSLQRSQLKATRILVVEDDPQGMILLKMLLEDLGVTHILEAPNGAEAWKIVQDLHAQKIRVGLIICDWNMPEMTGIELLTKVREIDHRTPFLMITGRGSVESTVEAKMAGVTAYVAKPYTPLQITEKILKALGLL